MENQWNRLGIGIHVEMVNRVGMASCVEMASRVEMTNRVETSHVEMGENQGVITNPEHLLAGQDLYELETLR
jgi:hypothetical protein